MSETPPAPDTAAYYREFSLQVGSADWRHENGRHLLIRQHLARLLGAARGLRVLDVGCGAGVLTSELCRYGDVTGTDLSAPAIALATQLEPRAAFVAGRFQELELGDGFDLITLFDVIEHIPREERAALLARLDALLARRGWLVLTTPHPSYTRRLREYEPHLLQIVDEVVEPEEILTLAAEHALELVDYRVYDVDRPGARQYQWLAFARARQALELPAGGRWRRLGRQLATLPVTPFPQLRRLTHAARLARAGRGGTALWLLGWKQALPGQSDR